MCGKVGYLGNKSAKDVIIKGLKRLEYRGYDSAGIATVNGGQLDPYVDTGVQVATPENMNTQEMKELHSPDLSKWLDK